MNDSHKKVETGASKPPVIAVDGPSGTGKGTLAQRLAAHLGWHYLDSGALYRAAAWAAIDQNIDPDDAGGLQSFLASLSINMHPSAQGLRVLCGDQDITVAIRDEAVGMMASRLSSNLLIRKHLLNKQLAFRQEPGLVTDGRDMGTVVFSDAQLKIFMTASISAQAQRRYKQLQQRGINANFANIEADLIKRDQRDRNRSVSPTQPALDAWVIDTTDLTVDQVYHQVLSRVETLRV